MIDNILQIAVISLAIFMAMVLAVGATLMVRDTVRKRGRWGVNPKPVYCPECGEPAPVVRMPKNWRQTLWGGCTCANCQTEYDKWGEPVPGKKRIDAE